MMKSRGKQGVKCPIYSYIWTVLYIPIYSYIWKTVLYIPIFQGKQEMLNSYLKQMLLTSNMNTSIVTEDRPHIGEATVCAIRTVEDAVEFYSVRNQHQKVPFTRKLLRSAKMAYASYRQSLDWDKEEKERQLKQQELGKAEKKRLEREREEEDKKKQHLC